MSHIRDTTVYPKTHSHVTYYQSHVNVFRVKSHDIYAHEQNNIILIYYTRYTICTHNTTSRGTRLYFLTNFDMTCSTCDRYRVFMKPSEYRKNSREHVQYCSFDCNSATYTYSQLTATWTSMYKKNKLKTVVYVIMFKFKIDDSRSFKIICLSLIRRCRQSS